MEVIGSWLSNIRIVQNQGKSLRKEMGIFCTAKTPEPTKEYGILTRWRNKIIAREKYFQFPIFWDFRKLKKHNFLDLFLIRLKLNYCTTPILLVRGHVLASVCSKFESQIGRATTSFALYMVRLDVIRWKLRVYILFWILTQARSMFRNQFTIRNFLNSKHKPHGSDVSVQNYGSQKP